MPAVSAAAMTARQARLLGWMTTGPHPGLPLQVAELVSWSGVYADVASSTDRCFDDCKRLATLGHVTRHPGRPARWTAAAAAVADGPRGDTTPGHAPGVRYARDAFEPVGAVPAVFYCPGCNSCPDDCTLPSIGCPCATHGKATGAMSAAEVDGYLADPRPHERAGN